MQEDWVRKAVPPPHGAPNSLSLCARRCWQVLGFARRCQHPTGKSWALPGDVSTLAASPGLCPAMSAPHPCPGPGPANAGQGIVHARNLCRGGSWALLGDACQGNVHARSPCHGGSWACLATPASVMCVHTALDMVSLGLCPATPAKAVCTLTVAVLGLGRCVSDLLCWDKEMTREWSVGGS